MYLMPLDIYSCKKHYTEIMGDKTMQNKNKMIIVLELI